MAGSTINGSVGAAASGLTVYATPVDFRGALVGLPFQTFVGANGLYSFSGLPAGTYNLSLDLSGIDPSTGIQPLTQPQVTVDGSSTYAV